MELLHILIYFSSVPSERRSFHKSFRQVLMAKGEKLYLSLNGNRIPTCYLFVGRFSRLLLSQTRERIKRIHSRSSGVDLWLSVLFGSNFVKHRSIIDSRLQPNDAPNLATNFPTKSCQFIMFLNTIFYIIS